MTHIAVGFAIFIPRILGCHLILNLREAYYRPFEEENGVGRMITTLQFDHPRSRNSLHSGFNDEGI